MGRIIVYLDPTELEAVRAIAEREMRGLREQARYLIIRALAAEIATQSPAPTAPAEEMRHAQAAQ